ncbi:HprK-related kinase A [Sphingomonas sp. YR710]|uniref:HprK-related kinase A n=1 Tax=Sphingomonas sp. YR710 TaxID=1882773 RepID=UPI000B819476|nr:HprK-related kinase A [Sphingomonas sp. YR710]
MMHRLSVRIGPATFRVGSTWAAPMANLRALYADYPAPADNITTLTARIEPTRPWRRWIRPQVAIGGDHVLPDTVPMALRHGLLAAEMAMNLQMVLGERRYLLLHAAAVERDGKALILTGESGSGKSTLAALLGEQGWRLLADEFVLVDPDTGLIHPFPRAISLKNSAIAAMEDVIADSARFGPMLKATPKGDLRHLRPNADAIARMDETARAALILFPQFGYDPAVTGIGKAELFMRLTQGSANYIALGERGYTALIRLATTVPSAMFAYRDSAEGIGIVNQFWAEAG